MTVNLTLNGTTSLKKSVPSPINHEIFEPSHEPRICMPSWRNFRKKAYQGGIYEAQDVLVEIDDVDLICLDPGIGFSLREYWQKRLIWKDVTKKLAFVNPGLRAIRPRRQYELFVVVCQNWSDLLYLNAIKGWKECCRISVCWIDELWAKYIRRYKNWLHLLNRFDHIIINLGGSVRAVEDALGRPCHWLPNGIDAIRFSPYPNPPARVIDIYSIGRRCEGVHRALLNQVAIKEIFYIYDTINVNETHLPDYRQHRDLIASIAKRSRFFLVAPAKMDNPYDTGGQDEVGSRYFEGAAAGAVLLGKKSGSDSYQKLFGWQDAIIEIQSDGSDLADVLSNLLDKPERIQEISRRNSKEALLRHDWAYRWKQILNIAGLKPRPAMKAREQRLKQLAEMAKSYDSE